MEPSTTAHASAMAKAQGILGTLTHRVIILDVNTQILKQDTDHKHRLK